MKKKDIDRIIEMAWEDRTPYEALFQQFGLTERQLIQLMRRHLKPRSFSIWRQRHRGRKTKHLKLRLPGVIRSHCKTQYKIKN